MNTAYDNDYDRRWDRRWARAYADDRSKGFPWGVFILGFVIGAIIF